MKFCWFLFLNLSLSATLVIGRFIQNVDQNPDIPVISNVLHEIVDEFILKENQFLRIIMYKVNSQFLLDVAYDFVSKIKEKFTFLRKTEQLIKCLFYNSAVFFIESLDSFPNIEFMFKITRPFDFSIKLITFIPNLTFDQLQSSNVYRYYSDLSRPYSTLFQYMYFVTNEADTVTLSTVEWFSPYGCDQPYLSKLNTFNKKSQKCALNPKFSFHKISLLDFFVFFFQKRIMFSS